MASDAVTLPLADIGTAAVLAARIEQAGGTDEGRLRRVCGLARRPPLRRWQGRLAPAAETEPSAETDAAGRSGRLAFGPLESHEREAGGGLEAFEGPAVDAVAGEREVEEPQRRFRVDALQVVFGPKQAAGLRRNR